MHEDGVVLADGDDGVGGHAYPVTPFESEWFASHEDDVLGPVETFHFEKSRLVLVEPQAGAEVERRSLVGLGSDVAADHHQRAVGDRKVEKRRFRGDGQLPFLDDFYGAEQGLAEHVVGYLLLARREAHLVECVQEKGKAALRVGGALDEKKVLVVDVADELLLDAVEAQDTAVVHEHDVAVGEGMAVGFGQYALGRCPDMAKNEPGFCAL